MRFSLVIPCYNEEKNLPLLLERCQFVAEYPDIEVILVDNGSSDRTQEVLKDLLPDYPGCRSIKVEQNKGYGFGILEGLRAAQGELLGWTHADMQTDPQDVIEGLKFFEQHGHDTFVKGRRYGRPFADVLFTIGMSAFETALLRKLLWDINAQPTMFSKRFFDSWVNPPLDFSLDLFAYYQAHEKGLKRCRFPVHFGDRAHGSSHWNVDWNAKKAFIRRTVEYSLNLRKEL